MSLKKVIKKSLRAKIEDSLALLTASGIILLIVGVGSGYFNNHLNILGLVIVAILGLFLTTVLNEHLVNDKPQNNTDFGA